MLFVDPSVLREGLVVACRWRCAWLYVALKLSRENLALVKVVDGSTTVAVDSATDLRWQTVPGTHKTACEISEVRPWADLKIHILSSRSGRG